MPSGVVPKSVTSTMLGWRSRLAARASARKRRASSGFSEMKSGPGGVPTYTTAVTFTNGQSSNTLATTLTKAETTTITATDGTVAGRYRLQWEDEVKVVDGTACGFDKPTRRYGAPHAEAT